MLAIRSNFANKTPFINSAQNIPKKNDAESAATLLKAAIINSPKSIEMIHTNTPSFLPVTIVFPCSRLICDK